MIPQTDIQHLMIAPCGINCSLCRAYLRKKNKCAGCNTVSGHKPYHCLTCKIKNCLERNEGSGFCFDCGKYPCTWIQHIDKRYRTRYSLSLIRNLDEIREFGLDRFMENERIRWTCSHCGGPVCIHTGKCCQC